MIKFTIGGRQVDPRNMEDALMAAILEGIREEITEKIGATGFFFESQRLRSRR